MDYSHYSLDATDFEMLLRFHLLQILGAEKAKNYCLLHWISPKDQRPDNGSYVLIKFLDADGETICSCPASYEKEQFWDLFSDDPNLVINPQIILGWSYYPYDDRIL